MKKKLSLLASAFVLFAASSASNAGVECLTPYIGVDAQYRHMGFKRNFGHNIFKNHYPQANAYIGLMFSDFVGVEAGFEYAWKRSINKANGAGSIELGDTHLLIPGEVNFSTNSSRIYGPHVSLVGFSPFCICDEHFEFYGSVGVARLKANLVYQPTAFRFEGQFFELTPAQLAQTKISFSKHKAVLRLGLGFNYMMHECAGVRLGVIWENTKKFNRLRGHTADLAARASMKDSFIYNLGIFWRFH